MLVGAASQVSTMTGTLRATNRGGVALRATNRGGVVQIILGGLIIGKIMAAVDHQDRRQEGSLKGEYANIMRVATAGRVHPAITFTVDLHGREHIEVTTSYLTFLYSLIRSLRSQLRRELNLLGATQMLVNIHQHRSME